MTEYKTIFRAFYHHDRQQLTLPPDNLWSFTFGQPFRQKINGHDYVVNEYQFLSFLLGPVSSIAFSEPLLEQIGGTFSDSWNMPIDESTLFQRTGYACIDELDFPPNGIDSENTWVYYDDTCGFETPANQSCHFTEFPEQDCIAALEEHGMHTLTITWERIAWNNQIANSYRFPSNTSTLSATPNAAPVPGSLSDNRIYWRYYTNTSCEVQASENNCIKAAGWRKVLTFQSVSMNVAKTDMIIGVPTFKPWSETNTFTYSACLLRISVEVEISKYF